MMLDDGNEMSTPVTRGELREELAQLEDRIERKFDGKLEQLESRIDGKLEQLESRIDGKLEQLENRIDRKFDLWGGALLARMDKRTVELEERILGELARHTQAVLESMTKQIAALDDKYSDLPRRMARVEADVDALKQR